MADLILKVRPTKTFEFTPNELVVRTIATDIAGGNAVSYYELKDTTLDNSRYISRDWSDKGNVNIPLALLANATDGNGNINETVVNMFLAAFNLELDTTV